MIFTFSRSDSGSSVTGGSIVRGEAIRGRDHQVLLVSGLTSGSSVITVTDTVIRRIPKLRGDEELIFSYPPGGSSIWSPVSTGSLSSNLDEELSPVDEGFLGSTERPFNPVSDVSSSYSGLGCTPTRILMLGQLPREIAVSVLVNSNRGDGDRGRAVVPISSSQPTCRGVGNVTVAGLSQAGV